MFFHVSYVSFFSPFPFSLILPLTLPPSLLLSHPPSLPPSLFFSPPLSFSLILPPSFSPYLLSSLLPSVPPFLPPSRLLFYRSVLPNYTDTCTAQNNTHSIVHDRRDIIAFQSFTTLCCAAVSSVCCVLLAHNEISETFKKIIFSLHLRNPTSIQ